MGKNVVPELPEKSAESYFEKGINELNNKFTLSSVSGIMLINI